MQAAVKIIKTLVLAATTAEAAYMSSLIKTARSDCSEDCDYLLILGCKIIDAETPSRQLLERIEKAAEYLKAHPSCIAVPCGGCFRREQIKSEALVIAEQLKRRGIASDRFLLEDKSTTTAENFRYAASLIEAHSGKPISESLIAVLSSDYHLYRAGLLAEENGIRGKHLIGSKTQAKRGLSFLREAIIAPVQMASTLKNFETKL